MPTLRLTQTALGDDRYQAMLSLDNGIPTTAQFSFALSAQDQEDLRWYLEDYLEYPLDPAPKIAARVEARMRDIGMQLFKDVFYANDTARDMATFVRQNVASARIEILTDIKTATAIPWELLRDPLTDVPLALRAEAIVRTQANVTTPRNNFAVMYGADKIRILLVICRPRAGNDVPFRSVASRIVRALSDDSRQIVQLDVLRPPTFEQLAKILRQAKSAGAPYHIVHFDGHGVYATLVPDDAEQEADKDKASAWLQAILKQMNAITLGAPRSGKHGYLLFENPGIRENMTLVDGLDLGNLMVETGVPVLVLNACQSAFAEAKQTPQTEDVGTDATTQEQVRAFGSFAQEVMNTGVAGVVAMRYVLYVETAKRFVTDLYSALLQGDTLGEAVTYGRKQLASNPQREIAYRPIELQDWAVPIVYEAAPIQMFPRRQGKGGATPPLRITLEAREKNVQGLPPPPDAGFFGRDETLYALDRAFDNQSIVLLHAYAGSGKTTTAAEFARWYLETGGLKGPILFTSFEQYKPLARVLDTFGAVFEKGLEQAGVQWLALSDEERRGVALQVMEQVPVLWIWDNVEPVGGFPSGTKSAWSEEEQKELKEFLSAARETQAKFLLTSRRDEEKWLGELPRRITLPAMPMQERWQLARALAEKLGRQLDEVGDWKPLLIFTQGNPLTITVLVGQALRDGLRTRGEVEEFVGKLRAGEAAFEDEASEGRSKSLGASLSYGFETAFSDDERKILALLHFFQGFVDVDTLAQMGKLQKATGEDYTLPEVRGLTRKQGIALLDRAAEIGLLTGYGGGFYSIHPALPWYFKNLFEEYYAKTSDGMQNALNPPTPFPSTQNETTRAFVEAMAQLGVYYQNQYDNGKRDVIGVLGVEELNLLYARTLALQNGWWRAVTRTMQGLNVLYDHTGRRTEWAQLVKEIVPDFVDSSTDGPLEGLEEEWDLITEYRVLLAEEARQWSLAERLQLKTVEWTRQRTASFLSMSLDSLNPVQRNAIRTLGASLHELGEIQREQESAECLKSYQESLQLFERIEQRMGAATCAFNISNAYRNIPGIRNLAEAEQWTKRALGLFKGLDQQLEGKCLSQLGHIARERFKEGRDRNMPESELLKNLNEALSYYELALKFDAPNAYDDLAVDHNQLGNIYKDVGNLDLALPHYREAIRYTEATGNFYQVGIIRGNVALALAQSGRFADALDYAQAALRSYETFGERAADEIENTKKLIAAIEEAMKKG